MLLKIMNKKVYYVIKFLCFIFVIDIDNLCFGVFSKKSFYLSYDIDSKYIFLDKDR